MTEVPPGTGATGPTGAAGATGATGAADTAPTGGIGAHDVVVIGGGIAGLAAAWEAAGRGLSVTVLDAADRPGGKIRTEPLAGTPVDTGPDAFLARVPWAVDLCGEIGLGDELVSPATGTAYLWQRGRLRRLPAGLVLGVPAAAGPVARSGILSPAGLARAGLDLVLPGRPVRDDETVGALVRRRLGHEVLERLVDPLVGGINAGDTDHLSLDASAPQLAAVAHTSRSLVLGLRAARRRQPPDPSAPVFHAVPGGMERLVGRLVERLTAAGVVVRRATTATALTPVPGGYRVDVEGSGPVRAASVVLATPALAAATLLRPHAGGAAAVLDGIEHASVALVTLAFPADAVSRRLDGSGFLVPRTEGRLMTACSWASSKWAHVGASGRVVLRVSAGRAGDDRALALGDDELTGRLRAELADAMGLRAAPVDQRVTRWERAFPQYAPGHLDRVAALEADLATRLPGVAVAGAAYRGVGIPACIASGRAAARHVAGRLAARSG